MPSQWPPVPCGRKRDNSFPKPPTPNRESAPRLHSGSPPVAPRQISPDFVAYNFDLTRLLQIVATGHVLVHSMNQWRNRRALMGGMRGLRMKESPGDDPSGDACDASGD